MWHILYFTELFYFFNFHNKVKEILYLELEEIHGTFLILECHECWWDINMIKASLVSFWIFQALDEALVRYDQLQASIEKKKKKKKFVSHLNSYNASPIFFCSLFVWNLNAIENVQRPCMIVMKVIKSYLVFLMKQILKYKILKQESITSYFCM